MEKHCLEGLVPHLLVAREDHADDPEEDNIVARDKDVRGIEILQVLCHLRPAECLKRPQCRREPGIQGIGILRQVRAAALRADGRSLCLDNGLAAVVAVPCGDSVAPPELTADAPVLDIVRPVKVGLFHGAGNKPDVAVLNGLHRRLDQLVHADEPLLLDHRLHGRAAPVMSADIVCVVLDPDKKSQGLHLADNRLPCFVTVHSAELAAVLIDRRVVT